MKALVLEEKGVLSMQEREKPVPQRGEVLIRVSAVSVCGSDIHAYKGANALITYPRVLGHEVCGVIEEINSEDQKGFSVGDKVILIPYLHDGTCLACSKGKSNCCYHLSVYGVHHDGAMADYVTAPLDYILKISPSTDPAKAAVIEPLSISAHAVRRSGVRMGETILIIGAGPIGLGAAEVARTLGAHVILADTDKKRREMVKEKFGYKTVLNPLDENYKEEFMKLTGGSGAPRIIDSTGNGASMSAAVNLLSNGGRLVYVGIYKGDLAINHPAFHVRESEIVGSRAADKEDFQYVIDCVEAGTIDPFKFITHSASFSEAKEAFEEWVRLGGDVMKAVIRMN